MLINSNGALVFEVMKIKTAVKNQDGHSIQKYYQEYESRLSVPKRDVTRSGFLTLCSENISYHLLSVYLLLDLIECFWNGKRFINDTVEQRKIPLLEHLSLEKKGSISQKAEIQRALEKVGGCCDTPLHVFLLPYESPNDFILEFTYPGNALILFAEKKENPENNNIDFFYKGISEFYLQKHLKGFSPSWAKNDEMFHQEFIAWCQGKSSKFI